MLLTEHAAVRRLRPGYSTISLKLAWRVDEPCFRVVVELKQSRLVWPASADIAAPASQPPPPSVSSSIAVVSVAAVYMGLSLSGVKSWCVLYPFLAPGFGAHHGSP